MINVTSTGPIELINQQIDASSTPSRTSSTSRTTAPTNTYVPTRPTSVPSRLRMMLPLLLSTPSMIPSGMKMIAPRPRSAPRCFV